MSQDFSQLETRIKNLNAYLLVVQEEAKRLMKEVEQLSASLPSRGRKKGKPGPLSETEIARFKANRLRQITTIEK
ncbi:hypothetical protein [Chitinophaga sp. LS1]|uniref:hypothetical protein n=1 Tax=Chitinophaga sp. LS1 TaxID=3051176 RepID=UPI002AAAC2BE|nr:hypothetical protein [Chitinophaga sp. LS1]WPV66322.1 hypothetical protein QQL36_31485 [Chitinophaga sp. LS1]